MFGCFGMGTIDGFKKHMHRTHVRTEDAPLFHGEVEHIDQQAQNQEERVEHGGQPELAAKHPQAFMFQIKAKEAERNAEKERQADSLDDPAALRVF